MIRPMLLYCYPIYLSIGERTKKKLQSNQDRAYKIMPPSNNTTLKIDTLDQVRKKRVTIDVYKALNGSCPPPLRNMFKRFNHGKDKRENCSRLILPKVKTDSLG